MPVPSAAPSPVPDEILEFEKLAAARKRFFEEFREQANRRSPYRVVDFPAPVIIDDEADALSFDWYMVGRDLWSALGALSDEAAARG